MGKTILFALLSLQSLSASSISLEMILDSANQNSSLRQAISQEKLSREALHKAENASQPLELYGTISQADPMIGKNAKEYSIGISQNVMLGDIRKQEADINHLINQAIYSEEEKTVLDFNNGLKNLYHQHCIDKNIYQSVRRSYESFLKLYQKKQKAYTYQEISKVELIRLEVEKEQLYAQLKEVQRKQHISRENLLRFSHLEHNQTMLCADIYPINAEALPRGNHFVYTKDAYRKRMESLQKKVQRYATSLESVELSMQYDKEMDMDRYSLGVSIPLGFTSQRSEQKRLEALHQSSALQHRYEHTMIQKQNDLSTLQSELKNKVMLIESLRLTLKNYQNHLLPLIDKSYNAGESSVIDYLLTQQRYRQLQQEYYANQKSYYHMLFQLYTHIEKKDK
ncbi:MAG: TolC family protein [Sulfurovum sp.]|nr:TolC family protein [Sulfurovum sp.]